MPRCENCGLRLEGPTTLCPSCAHHRKKELEKAAREGRDVDARPEPPPPPDLDALRERLRQVQRTLAVDEAEEPAEGL